MATNYNLQPRCAWICCGRVTEDMRHGVERNPAMSAGAANKYYVHLERLLAGAGSTKKMSERCWQRGNIFWGDILLNEILSRNFLYLSWGHPASLHRYNFVRTAYFHSTAVAVVTENANPPNPCTYLCHQCPPDIWSMSSFIEVFEFRHLPIFLIPIWLTSSITPIFQPLEVSSQISSISGYYDIKVRSSKLSGNLFCIDSSLRITYFSILNWLSISVGVEIYET